VGFAKKQQLREQRPLQEPAAPAVQVDAASISDRPICKPTRPGLDDVVKRAPDAIVSEAPPKKQDSDSVLITLDFGKRPDILAFFKGRADAEFRTVDQQILWVLNNVCHSKEMATALKYYMSKL